MPVRHDALAAAAELILAVESAARESGAIDSVATVGVCDVFPGAINSVPSRVRLEVDIRDTDLARRDGMTERLGLFAQGVAKQRGVSISFETVNADPPAACSPAIIQAIETAADSAGISHRRIVSRAYHDSLFMARLCPVAMIFIPCLNGVSHRPDEYCTPDQIRAGIEVLARTLSAISSPS